MEKAADRHWDESFNRFGSGLCLTPVEGFVNPAHLDELARQVATCMTRRDALKTFALGLLLPGFALRPARSVLRRAEAQPCDWDPVYNCISTRDNAMAIAWAVCYKDLLGKPSWWMVPKWGSCIAGSFATRRLLIQECFSRGGCPAGSICCMGYPGLAECFTPDACSGCSVSGELYRCGRCESCIGNVCFKGGVPCGSRCCMIQETCHQSTSGGDVCCTQRLPKFCDPGCCPADAVCCGGGCCPPDSAGQCHRTPYGAWACYT